MLWSSYITSPNSNASLTLKLLRIVGCSAFAWYIKAEADTINGNWCDQMLFYYSTYINFP